MKTGWRWYDGLFFLLFIYLFVLQLSAIWAFTIDDMYISLRYAKNWAAGEGLLWNINAPPVEGYSNFLFVLFGAVALMLHVDPVLVLKGAGALGLLFSCYFIYLLSRFWFAKREALLPCIALLFYKGQIIWAVSGLETTVYEALIGASVYCCFRGMGYHLFPQDQGRARLRFLATAGICLAFAGMTRPEAPALMALFFLLLCWEQIRKRAFNWQELMVFCLPILLLFFPYFTWRFFYFGSLFPNSVYCKGMLPTLSVSLDLNYLQLIWPWALFSLIACIRAPDSRYYFLWMPSVVYLLMLANADPIVAFYNRLFLPAFALLLPLALQGMRGLLLYFSFNAAFLYPLFLGCVLFFIPKMTLGDYFYFSEYPVKGEQLRFKVVDWLHENTQPGNAVVLADAGLIPYQSNLNFIDSYCLNNKEMAHQPAQQRYELFCHNILQQKPAVIILTSLKEPGRVIYTPSDLCLKKLLSNQSEYQLQHTFYSETSGSVYRYEIFTRNRG